MAVGTSGAAGNPDRVAISFMASRAASELRRVLDAHCSGVPHTRLPIFVPNGLIVLQTISGSSFSTAGSAGAAPSPCVAGNSAGGACAAGDAFAARRRSRRDSGSSAGAALEAAAADCSCSVCASAMVDGTARSAAAMRDDARLRKWSLTGRMASLPCMASTTSNTSSTLHLHDHRRGDELVGWARNRRDKDCVG
jgi:hypothetical protein